MISRVRSEGYEGSRPALTRALYKNIDSNTPRIRSISKCLADNLFNGMGNWNGLSWISATGDTRFRTTIRTPVSCFIVQNIFSATRSIQGGIYRDAEQTVFVDIRYGSNLTHNYYITDSHSPEIHKRDFSRETRLPTRTLQFGLHEPTDDDLPKVQSGDESFTRREHGLGTAGEDAQMSHMETTS